MHRLLTKPRSSSTEQLVTTSKSTPTLQVVVNPQPLRGAMLHGPSFKAPHERGADYLRYVPCGYPIHARRSPNGPLKDNNTSWDFTHIEVAVVTE